MLLHDLDMVSYQPSRQKSDRPLPAKTNPSLAAARRSYTPDNQAAGSENRSSTGEEHRYSFAAQSKDEPEAGGSRTARRSPALCHTSPCHFRDEACPGTSDQESPLGSTDIATPVVLAGEPERRVSHRQIPRIHEDLWSDLLHHDAPKRMRDEYEGTIDLLSTHQYCLPRKLSSALYLQLLSLVD